jgi:hypothetical protein
LEIDNKVVARYLDGRVLKGITRDFSPNRVSFHVEVHGSGEIVELRCRQLKALFFVRSLDGDPTRQDLLGFVEGPAETAQGRKIAVRFRDNEFVCGYTLSWSPDREGFFMFPSDAGSNNQRIYVVTTSTDEVKAGMQAEALAQRLLAESRARDPRSGAPRPAGTGPATSPGIARPAGLVPRSTGQFTRPPLPGARTGGVHESGGTARPSGALPRPSGLHPKPPSSDAA